MHFTMPTQEKLYTRYVRMNQSFQVQKPIYHFHDCAVQSDQMMLWQTAMTDTTFSIHFDLSVLLLACLYFSASQ